MSFTANWVTELGNSAVQCTLCPHYCILTEGSSGVCKVRKNENGVLVSKAYGYVTKIGYEKAMFSTLSDFYSDEVFLSIGTYGCNFSCFFCRGCNELLTRPQTEYVGSEYTADQLVNLALNHPGCTGIVFTYNEPTVWIEYMLSIAEKAKQHGLKTIINSNGFINPEPLRAVIELIDAFCIDIKAFSEEFYQKVNSSRLEPVKNSLIAIAASGRHLELFHSIIPGLNDKMETFEEMINWIKTNLGENTILNLALFKPGNTNGNDIQVNLSKYQKVALTALKKVQVASE